MHIIDVSWPLSESTTGYKDRKIIKFEARKTFEKDNVRESTITLDTHSGTHVDAPSHFLADGATIDATPLEKLIGPAIVLDLTHVQEKITREILQHYNDVILPQHIVLLKTTNSLTNPQDLFIPHFVYLEASGAQYLREKEIYAVGIDYLGIERNQPGHPTHKELLGNGVVIIEGLRLAQAPAGTHFFCCLPLAFSSLEASPARAVLIVE